MDDDNWQELLYEDILQIEVPEIDKKVIEAINKKTKLQEYECKVRYPEYTDAD